MTAPSVRSIRGAVVPALAAAALLSACNKSSSPSGPSASLQSVSVAVTNDIVFIGSTEQATATGTRSDGTTVQPAGTWSSDNQAVAAVNGAGVITGVASGTATIIFTSQGANGTKLVRVLPRFQGTWSGSYQVTSCGPSGVFVDLDTCDEFAVGSVWPTSLTLTQGARDVVSGRIFLGSLQTDSFTAGIEADGSVVMIAAIHSGDFTIDVGVDASSAQPGQMLGRIAHVWRVSGFAGTMQVGADLRNVSRIAGAASATDLPAPPAVMPRTLTDLVGAMRGR